MRIFSLLGLTAASLGLGSTAHAQTSFSIGPRVGLNYANVTAAEDGLSVTPDSRFGLQAGVMANLGFGNFAVQPALLYSQQGYKLKRSTEFSSGGDDFSYKGELDLRLNYLQLPVQVAYALNADGQGLQFFAGPYVSFGLSGRETAKTQEFTNGKLTAEDSESADVVFDGKAPERNSADERVHFKRLDFGLQGGLGYRAGGLLAQLGYSQGLRNFYVPEPNPFSSNEEGSLKNHWFQLSLTYLVGGAAR